MDMGAVKSPCGMNVIVDGTVPKVNFNFFFVQGPVCIKQINVVP